YLYLPVHKLSDIKWKDLGQHISQLVPIENDERVIDVFTEPDFKQEADYLMSTKNGMIKKSELGLFKTTRFNKPLIAMKLKDDDVVINVMRIESP
ncbi:hypothetical protein NL503_27485, partial [Klebsiella pneumoniae]|nr:hypothetical protein [Klebsiella pneumoniae]